MPTLTLFLLFFLFLHSAAAAAAPPPPYTPTDYFLLNCGSSSTANSADGRSWDGDALSKFSPSNIATTSSASTAAEQHPSVTQVPYMTARIFHSPFTYTFPVLPGPKFLRLYFYPATYSGLDKTKSVFSVTAAAKTLLSNFNASRAVEAAAADDQNSPVYLIKEYIISVQENEFLNITFSSLPSNFAFINGIEVVSVPSGFYMGRDDNAVKLVTTSQNPFFHIDYTTAFETLYRLNVGGNDVPVTGDTGMFRAWSTDDNYVGAAIGFTPHRDIPIRFTQDTPAYTAPKIVYTTSRTMGNLSSFYNLTWILPVDSGFYYLLRLHFCEIQLEVTLPNQRVFTIFINNQTAELSADVIEWTGGVGTPVFKDYVIRVPESGGRRSKQDLWLSMHPYMDDKPEFGDALLNGLEIFKLNDSQGSLAGANPELRVYPSLSTPPPGNRKKKRSSPFAAAIGIAAGGVIVLVVIIGFLIFRLRKKVDPSATTTKTSWGPLTKLYVSTKTSVSSLPSDLCRHFPLIEMKSATNNFDDNFVIGTGGFGNVYKGYIDNGETAVAIKRLNPSSNQGAREFQTEIEMLSNLRHYHLVSLIGFCDEDGEMILVYDYMANGTLRDHLYKNNNPSLPWKQRLQICIGAAEGLQYLHAGAKHTIIHRDVKSTNILLDEKWVAKVSDFGLSKVGPMDTSQSHVSTTVKGSVGYVDPEYYRTQQLSEKSDVYSFGVVLFEVLCARPAVVLGLPEEQVNLAEWCKGNHRSGTLDQIIDPNLRGEIAQECLQKFGEVADSCLRGQGIQRPTMGDVVWGLEFAMQVQRAAEVEKMGQVTDTCMVSPSPLLHGETTTTDDDDAFSKSAGCRTITSLSTTSTSGDGFQSKFVFSELMNPTDR